MVKDQAARHYLADALCAALFRQPGPTRLWALLSALPDRVTCAPETAEEVMREDPRFRQVVTRWDLAHRATAGSRPLGGALEGILLAYGQPMPRSLLIAELCLSRPGDPPQFDELLQRLLLSARDIGSFGGHVFLTRWLTDTSSKDDASRLFVNGLADDTHFLSVRSKLTAASQKHRQVLETAEAVLKTAKEPLSNRALGLVLAHHHGDRFDPAETLAAMHGDARFLALSGPVWTLASQEKTYLRALAKVKPVEETAPPQVDLEALLRTKPQKVKVPEGTLNQATELAEACRTPVDLEELLTDLLQLGPRQRNFAPAAHVLDHALATDASLMRLSPGRYLSRRTLPPWVATVPEALVPEVVPLAPGEKPLDVLLPLEQLAPGLTERVLDPVYEDEGEVAVTAEPVEDVQTAMPVAGHHHRCGTMKLRQRDARLFDQQGPITLVTFITPAGERLPVWVNQQTRLLYGFLTWYDEALPPCGAVVTIKRDGDDRDVYHLLYKGETDAGTYIGKDRLAQLESLRKRLRRKRPFLVDIVNALLHGNDKGLPFDQLWSQVNVIRRTTRQMVASTLTASGQFGESGGRWRIA